MIAELWKESCLARRRFGKRKRELLRRGGDYEQIVTDSTLLGLKAEWRASRVRVRRAIWSSKEESWKELLSEVDADPWGFPFRIATQNLRSSSGPLMAGMTGEFLAEVIAELFPRVAPYAFPPADFAFDRERDRVTEGKIRILLDAASKKRSAPGPIESSANLSR